MTDVEQSPWLNITDLNTLNNADPALSGDDAAAIVPQSDGINDATQANLRQTLNTLAASTKRHQTIQRVHPHRRRRRCQAGPRRPQSVAQAARQRARHHGPARARRRKSSRKHHGGRSRATGVPAHQRRGHHTDGKRQRGQRNRANARYHQQQPPLSGHGKSLIIDQLHADRHFAFRHRGSARARRSPSGVHYPRGHLRHRGRTLSLQDRQGITFGATQTTHITSALQISDKTGFIIIGIAVLLGALGLWRQFHRKKDPDE